MTNPSEVTPAPPVCSNCAGEKKGWGKVGGGVLAKWYYILIVHDDKRHSRTVLLREDGLQPREDGWALE